MTARISFQGELGAYGHQACVTARPDHEPLPCDTFVDAVEAVRRGDADLAMIAVENSTYGRVADVHSILPNSGLHITDEEFVRVQINLLGRPGASLDQITTAHGHVVILPQCSHFLREHGIKGAISSDNAKAARDVAEGDDMTAAALASELAASIYGLDVLARNIEDADNNTTRFVVMAREPDLSKTRQTRHGHQLCLSCAEHSCGLVQGDGRLCDERRQHDQTRELYGQRSIHRDPVLCRNRRSP